MDAFDDDRERRYMAGRVRSRSWSADERAMDNLGAVRGAAVRVRKVLGVLDEPGIEGHVDVRA
jgi:hypothetical protein